MLTRGGATQKGPPARCAMSSGQAQAAPKNKAHTRPPARPHDPTHSVVRGRRSLAMFGSSIHRPGKRGRAQLSGSLTLVQKEKGRAMHPWLAQSMSIPAAGPRYYAWRTRRAGTGWNGRCAPVWCLCADAGSIAVVSPRVELHAHPELDITRNTLFGKHPLFQGKELIVGLPT